MSTSKIFKLLLLCAFLSLGFTEWGQLTTWNNDAVNTYCGLDSTQYCQNNYCSAPQVKAPCPTKPGKDTDENNKFKRICREGEYGDRTIDGQYIDENMKNRCLTCPIPVCDTPDYPAAPVQCKRPICVRANNKQVQTFEMDVCPSNHQKNVAKCCIWGGAYCSCVNITTLDLSSNALNALGNPRNGEWTIDQWCGNSTCGRDGSKCSENGNECGNKCDDIAPPGNSYTCAQQAEWGKCNESWMKGYCCKSCANAKKCGGDSGGSKCGNSCSNKPPPGNSYSCSDQAKWGKCKESWMEGYCCESCANANKCGGGGGNNGNTCGNSCSNKPPPGNSYTCEDQAKWGKCKESWMKGYCCKSCANANKCGGGGSNGGGNICGNSCSDSPPPNSGYSCSDQAKWGKCHENWMTGYCCKSCANANRCGGGGGGSGGKTCGSSCSDNPPPNSGYSCAEQAKWGKCHESWMTGYCCKSCANSYKCGGTNGGGWLYRYSTSRWLHMSTTKTMGKM